MCYFYNTDYRGKSLPRYQDEIEVCEVIALTSPDEKHSINIEIWDGGETEVSLLPPIGDIVDLFPESARGQKQEKWQRQQQAVRATQMLLT